MEEILVVKDFLDVVPEELPRLPPSKENEFGIDVPQLFQKKVRSVEKNSRMNLLKGGELYDPHVH